MNIDKRYIVESIALFCDTYEAEFYEHYFGRGMMDTSCVGLICKSPLKTYEDLLLYFFYQIEIDTIDDAIELMKYLGSPCQDDMGMRMILYFPLLETTNEYIMEE